MAHKVEVGRVNPTIGEAITHLTILSVFFSFHISSALVKCTQIDLYFSVMWAGRFVATHFVPLQQFA